MRNLAAVMMLAIGCTGGSLPLERRCHVERTAPTPFRVDATGDLCRGPDFDGVHVEVQDSTRQIVIASESDLASGKHSGTMYVLGEPPRSATIDVMNEVPGWSIRVSAIDGSDLLLFGN